MPQLMEKIRKQWPTLLFKIGIVVGFLSIFILWAIPKAGIVYYPEMTFVPSTSLAYFIQLPFITLPQVLPTFLHPDVWALAFLAAWLFLFGLLAQLFTRWGLISQAIAIALFVPLIVTWPLNIGPGFVLGCVSAVMIALGYYLEK